MSPARWAVLCAVAASGCASSAAIQEDLERDLARARYEWVEEHRDEITADEADAIPKGEVFVGMRAQLVLLSWSNYILTDRQRYLTETGETESWTFRRMRGLYNYDYRTVWVEDGYVTAATY